MGLPGNNTMRSFNPPKMRSLWIKNHIFQHLQDSYRLGLLDPALGPKAPKPEHKTLNSKASHHSALAGWSVPDL